jgi:hypothetical protein
MQPPFPAGLVVFFRVLDTTGNQLARSFHLTGRNVETRSEISFIDDYIVKDAEGTILGIYPRDFVSAILPIVTEGPGAQDANNSESGVTNPKEAKKRNLSRLS